MTIRFHTLLLALALSPQALAADPNTDPVYTAVRNAPIAETCTIENLQFTRDVGAFTLTRGTLSFTAPVQGRVTTAVFVGEGKFQLKPALNLEADNLVRYTGERELTEDITSAVFLFTDNSYSAMKEHFRCAPPDTAAEGHLRDFRRKARHRELNYRSGALSLLNGPEILNLDAEIAAELYRPQPDAQFLAYLHGRRYGDLRFFLRPRGAIAAMMTPEEVALVNVDTSETKDGVWYLTHTLDQWRQGRASSTEDHRVIALQHFKIASEINKSGHLAGVSEVAFSAVREGDRVIRFELLPNLRVSAVSLAGQPVAYIQEARNDDGSFYVVMPENMPRGKAYTLKIEYEGNQVVYNEGNGNFAVSARENWYPNANVFADRATFDLTFRVPRSYTLVSIGKLVSDERDGDYQVTRWQCDHPVLIAGFNFGEYKKKSVVDDQTRYQVEAYATAEVPDSIRRFSREAVMSPSSMAQSALVDGENAVRVFTTFFGPLPYGRVAITQQPQFGFGQSWPTLVYLPVSAFLDSTQRWMLLDNISTSLNEFVLEVTPHEVAHQWWGHMVGWSTYHDQWLSEGFADFSAGLFLQQTGKNQNDYFKYLDRSREMILKKNTFGMRPNDAGPIWMGYRLDNFKSAGAARRMIYPKGGLVLHMLRRLMYDNQNGDQDFVAMMHDYVSTYAGKQSSTEDFRRIVEKHIKPSMNVQGNNSMQWFFADWVYGSDIPSYNLQYRLTPDKDGKTLLTFKVTQSGVSKDFVMRVGVYGDFGKGPVLLGQPGIAGNSTTSELKVMLPKKPAKILLNANRDVLSASESVETL